MKFHDGSDFNADAAIWNLDRYYKKDAKQFDPPGGAVAQARNPFVAGYRKIDDNTIEITNPRPLSYFPNMLPYMLYSSPAQFEKTGSWAEFAKSPSGTGPFKITEFKPRVSVTLSRNDGYWEKARVPKLDKMVLFPMPEATTRLAALRSGQVDWIEVPPPDAVPSLKARRLRNRHRQLSAHVAMGVQPRQGGFAVEGRARAPGAQLLPQSRGVGDAS